MDTDFLFPGRPHFWTASWPPSQAEVGVGSLQYPLIPQERVQESTIAQLGGQVSTDPECPREVEFTRLSTLRRHLRTSGPDVPQQSLQN